MDAPKKVNPRAVKLASYYVELAVDIHKETLTKEGYCLLDRIASQKILEDALKIQRRALAGEIQ